MRTSSNIRVISIALTLAIAVGIGLFLEYDARSLAPVATAPQPLEQPARVTQSNNNAAAAPAPMLAEPPRVTTFKCARNGRISFSDRPCAANERLLGTSTSVVSPPHDTQAELARTQAAVVRMEAEHRQREGALVRSMPVTPEEPSAGGRKASCDDIDRRISDVDSALRQPHSADRGDYLTSERRKLTDRRFSVGC